MKIGLIVHRLFGAPRAADYTRELIGKGECRLALDVGCGGYSHLNAFRPRITTVGIDAFPEAIELSKARDTHDRYIVADILREDLIDLLDEFGGAKFDLVTLYDVIEHLPKKLGYELLDRCEQLTSKYLLLQTPNGFLEQGPEFGNEHQRHLSGWFAHDFEGLGYKVYGTTGTKYLRGYAAGPKYKLPGILCFDTILGRLLRIQKHHRHAFNLIAIKDVRGVPARLS
jgi:SAM-dependent methyltransferase